MNYYCMEIRVNTEDAEKEETVAEANVHCKFKRPDLTAKLNAILAKHHPNALPSPH